MKMRKNIFTKLFLAYIGIFLVSFIVNSSIFYLLYQSELRQLSQDAITHELNQIEKTFELAHKENMSHQGLISALTILTANEHRALYFYDQLGQPLYTISPHDEEVQIDQSVVEQALDGKTVKQHIRSNGKPMFLVSVPVITSINEEMSEKVLVIVHLGFGKVLKELQKSFLLAALIALIITACFIYYISKRLTAPLREMNEVALEYAKGRFDKKTTIRSNDEIGQLGKTFNHMASELEGLDLMRKEFVANVSHDLRSPLTSINGFVGAMLDGTIPTEKQPYYLSLMKEETERLIKLVNELLDIARMEAGQLSINPISYNVSEQIRKIIAKMEAEISKKNIEIHLPENDNSDMEVYADPERMDQVLGNLMQNAVYFSPQNGNIEITLTTIGQQVEIAIRDNGPGIKSEDLEHIWDRFFKADKARSKKVGTGIGLSIVKHIVELHQAKIEVRSDLGKGSVFILTLPTNERK